MKKFSLSLILLTIFLVQDIYAQKTLENLVLQDNVTSFGPQTVKGLKKYTKVVVPEGITTLEDETFKGCDNLEEVILPTSLKQIGRKAFSGCKSLRTVTLPNVETINDRAFENCVSLKSIQLPSTLVVIGSRVFQGCSSLESLEYPQSLRTLGAYVVNKCSGLKRLVLPCTFEYENHSNRKDSYPAYECETMYWGKGPRINYNNQEILLAGCKAGTEIVCYVTQNPSDIKDNIKVSTKLEQTFPDITFMPNETKNQAFFDFTAGIVEKRIALVRIYEQKLKEAEEKAKQEEEIARQKENYAITIENLNKLASSGADRLEPNTAVHPYRCEKLVIPEGIKYIKGLITYEDTFSEVEFPKSFSYEDKDNQYFLENMKVNKMYFKKTEKEMYDVKTMKALASYIFRSNPFTFRRQI